MPSMSGRPFARNVAKAFGMATLAAALALPASAQYPMMVFGGGYARDCYLAVKEGKLRLQDALAVCDTALSQEQMPAKNRAATFNNRGIVYMRLGDNERAAKDYEAALRILPDLPETKINLGAMLYTLGRYADALAALNDGVKAEDIGTRATAHYNRGLAHEMLGHVELAYADYNEALKLQPDFEGPARQLRRFRVIPGATS